MHNLDQILKKSVCWSSLLFRCHPEQSEGSRVRARCYRRIKRSLDEPAFPDAPAPVTLTNVSRSERGIKVPAHPADPSPQETNMITPINTPHPIDARQVAQPAAEPRPDPHAQTPPVHKSGEVSQDQVTLKSAAQPDPDRK